MPSYTQSVSYRIGRSIVFELCDDVWGGYVHIWRLQRDNAAGVQQLRGWVVRREQRESDGMRELRGLVWGWVLFDGGMHGHHEPELCFLQCWQFLGLCWRADIVFVVYVELQRGPVSEWDL